MEPCYACPRCGTQYFAPLAECDWCPEQAVVPIERASIVKAAANAAQASEDLA